MVRHAARALVTAATVLTVLLAILVAPVAADDRDPRCAAWERNGPPPGLDLAAACPPRDPARADVDLGAEPLVPYIVGLLVMACVLIGVGVVAMRLTARPPAATRPPAGAFWTCPACDQANRPDRDSCSACGGGRERPTTAEGTEASGSGATAASPGSHPA